MFAQRADPQVIPPTVNRPTIASSYVITNGMACPRRARTRKVRTISLYEPLALPDPTGSDASHGASHAELSLRSRSHVDESLRISGRTPVRSWVRVTGQPGLSSLARDRRRGLDPRRGDELARGRQAHRGHHPSNQEGSRSRFYRPRRRVHATAWRSAPHE